VDGTTGTATAIAAGDMHNCAIQAEPEPGKVFCWGNHHLARMTPPASVDGITGTATAIATGTGHSCAIQAGTDAVVCWGSDSDGQSTPPPFVDGTTGTATAIAAGGWLHCDGIGPSASCRHYGHSCAIQAGTDAVVCWGADDDGQSTPPPSVDGTAGAATAIATGLTHSCAIQAGTGAVVCWGDDGGGQSTTPPSVDGTTGTATAIAAGRSHSCAIQAGTGAVVCWGANWGGQVTPPPSVDGTTGTATAIAAGTGHTLAIRTPECGDGLDNDSDGSIDFPNDADCFDLRDISEALQAEARLKIKLKFNKPSRDKILVLIKDWQLPAWIVPADVTVNVGGAECTGALDAKGKFKSPDKRDSIKMKQDKKTELWSIAVKRKKNEFAADLADEGCTDSDNPEPGMPVTVPLIVTVDGVAYRQNIDLVYKSKQGKKGTAK
jgi:hypothetical protein